MKDEGAEPRSGHKGFSLHPLFPDIQMSRCVWRISSPPARPPHPARSLPYSSRMAEVPHREGERREKLRTRIARVRSVAWSWLTDPAVLLYRREAHGRARARVVTVEFFLFIREVTSEFYTIDGTSRAARPA